MIIADTSILSTFTRIQRMDLLFAVAETGVMHLPPAVQTEIWLDSQKKCGYILLQAVHFYEEWLLPFGKAAALAQMSLWSFIEELYEFTR
jgi:hypothetical protein